MTTLLDRGNTKYVCKLYTIPTFIDIRADYLATKPKWWWDVAGDVMWLGGMWRIFSRKTTNHLRWRKLLKENLR